MRADVRHADDVVIVDFKGDLVTEDGEEMLRDVVSELVAEGWTKILLNLARVKRLDSGGVGELVASWKLAHEFGAAVKLLRPGDRVRHTLHLSDPAAARGVRGRERRGGLVRPRLTAPRPPGSHPGSWAPAGARDQSSSGVSRCL